MAGGAAPGAALEQIDVPSLRGELDVDWRLQRLSEQLQECPHAGEERTLGEEALEAHEQAIARDAERGLGRVRLGLDRTRERTILVRGALRRLERMRVLAQQALGLLEAVPAEVVDHLAAEPGEEAAVGVGRHDRPTQCRPIQATTRPVNVAGRKEAPAPVFDVTYGYTSP